MSHPFDTAAFEDSILNSSDDYEPYGFLASHTTTVHGPHVDRRFGIYARAIEASVLDDFDSVGC